MCGIAYKEGNKGGNGGNEGGRKERKKEGVGFQGWKRRKGGGGHNLANPNYLRFYIGSIKGECLYIV